jgi:hypothetical protein
MPLFKRSDGDLVRDETPVRRFMPYMMPTRNGSIVYHDEYYDLEKTRPWIAAFNEAHGEKVTLFHVFLWGVGRGLYERPLFNRFVSAGRLYARRGAWISFSAKKQFSDKAPIVAVKMKCVEGEPFAAFLARYKEALGEGRSDAPSDVDKELGLALRLPGWLLAVAVWGLKLLDRLNLMPASMIRNDPMYASCFVANLGSIGLDHTYHHLYEWGTVGLFAAVGAPAKRVVPGPDDQPVVREVMEVRWSLDERIADGFYAARSLRNFRRIVENPEAFIGSPAEGASA